MANEKIMSHIREAYLSQAKLDTRLSEDAALSEKTIVLGKGGLLDSMSVVAFLLELEDRLKMPLLDEAMKEAQKTPGFTLGDLAKLIEKRTSV